MSVFVGLFDAVKDRGCFGNNGPDFSLCKNCKFCVKEIGCCFFDISSGIVESLLEFSGEDFCENRKKIWGLSDFFLNTAADDFVIIECNKCQSLLLDISNKIEVLNKLKNQPETYYEINHIKYIEQSLRIFSAILELAIVTKRGIEAG